MSAAKARDAKDPKDPKDSRDPKGARDAKGQKEAKGVKEARPAREGQQQPAPPKEAVNQQLETRLRRLKLITFVFKLLYLS